MGAIKKTLRRLPFYHGLCEAPFALSRALRLERLLPYAPRSLRERTYKIRMRRLEHGRLVPEQSLTDKFREGLTRLAAEQGAGTIGDYLEFGVYDGTSLSCMHRVLQEMGLDHVRLFGFDSFEGLPPTAAGEDGGYWRPGQFDCEYEFARYSLSQRGVDWSRVELIKGFYDVTLNDDLRQRLGLTKASVIMVDCDMYSSARDALNFCAPLIRDQAMVLFDDWNPLAESNMGEKLAFDEFLAANPHFAVEDFGTYTPNAKVVLVRRVG